MILQRHTHSHLLHTTHSLYPPPTHTHTHTHTRYTNPQARARTHYACYTRTTRACCDSHTHTQKDSYSPNRHSKHDTHEPGGMTITATHPLTKHLTLPGSKLARQPQQKEEYLVPTHFRPSPFKTPSATPTGLPSTVWSRAHTSGVSHCHYKAHPPTWTHLDTPQRLALKFHRTVISRWFEHRPITDVGLKDRALRHQKHNSTAAENQRPRRHET